MQPPYRSRGILPAIPSGYPLDDVFWVLDPIARTNLCINPSFETNTTSWTAIGGSIARSTTQQYHGAYSLAITPSAAVNDGVRYDTVTLVLNQLYAVSCKVYGQPGVKYKLSVATTGGTDLTVAKFTGSGRWQWISLYHYETTGAARRVVVTKDNSTDTHVFYCDGVQVEAINAGETVSTYLDGDQVGLIPNQYPPAYYWTGTPHASTSVRSGQTRAGGMLVKWKDYGWVLTAIVGLGLAAPQNVALPYTQLDGSQDQYTRKPQRQFSLVGRFEGETYPQLRRNRSALASLIDRDAIGLDQQLVLRHRLEDGCGRILSDDVRIPCKYSGGLGGNTTNVSGESASAQFTQFMPLILSDREQGTSLTVQATIANANRILYRDPITGWQAIGTGASTNSVSAIAEGRDGKLYIGGGFGALGGVANTKFIASYDPATGTIAALGTGGGAGGTHVNDIKIAPNGDVWVIGDFTGMGGVAGADYVVRWDGSVWNAVGTPPGSVTTSLNVQCGFDPSGNFYYARAGASVYKWNGSAWSTIGTSNNVVIGLTITPAGNVLAYGNFTTISAVSATNIAQYDTAAGTWAALAGTVPGSTVQTAGYALDGTLYAGGATGGSSCLWRWNGAAWVQVGAITGGTLYSIAAYPTGGVLFSGALTTAAGVTLADGIGIWDGSSLVPPDVDLPSTPNVLVVRVLRSGAIVVGYDTSGNATVASTSTTATNSGTAKSYPTVSIAGPSSGTARIYQIANLTTGRSIFLNYTINAGETAVLQFDPTNLSFTSTFAGNIASKILPNSDTANFFLQPGANVLSFFTAGSTVTATVWWRPAYNALDDVP